MSTVKKRRIWMSVIGVLISAVSISMFKLAVFGVDPFQTLMSGMEKLVPIPFGSLYVLVNIALLIFALVCDRHYIGIATFINLFLLGYVVQYCLGLLQTLFTAPSIVVRSISFIIGFILLCFGSSLYMTADLGVSTYDAVALVISNTWKKGKFKYVRICTDIVCVVVGSILFLLGGGSVSRIPQLVGIGTIATAFFMGPLIDFFNQRIVRLLKVGDLDETIRN